jgi:NTE family protein
MLSMAASPQFNLVLGGGGLKGLTHIGVLQALEERGLTPQAVIGCSIGALIAATWACRMPVAEMAQRAFQVGRADVFRIAHFDVAVKRLLAPAFYRREPLDHLIRSLVGDVTFRDLSRRLVVNTVDLNSGQQVLWGLCGLMDARVADAVFASCALPGILPPREILGRYCIDGAVIENLPVRAALAISRAPIIAVDIGGTRVERKGVERKGFLSTYSRGLEIVMQTLAAEQLQDWAEPPVVLVRPRVERVSMFAFNRTPFLLEEGRRAMNQALDLLPHGLEDLPPGIHPQREVRIRVDRDKCVGCGACVARAPEIFEMGFDGLAVAKEEKLWWSPLGDHLLAVCPTHAITAEQTWP